jgi:serine/threonine-protein kinase
MGQVYRAEHSLLKKTIALKVMVGSVRLGSEGHQRFIREARAAAAIKHPHVVDILDVGVLDGTPFIVMEFLEGVDLETHLQRRIVLSDQELADLALPIIAALGAVHDAGVVHRDIKPSNIFLSKGLEEDLVPKMLDFGISKALHGQEVGQAAITGPTELMGTPLYISPEGLMGAEHVTAKSDQYSLGVVLYECATGRTPFDGSDFNRLILDVSSRAPEPMHNIKPGVAPQLEAAVSRAMSRNPDDRFDHIRDLGTVLWGLASKRTQHVWAKRFRLGSPESTSTRNMAIPVAGGSTRRWQSKALAGAAVLVPAIATLSFLRSRPPEAASRDAAAVMPRPPAEAASSPLLLAPKVEPARSKALAPEVEPGASPDAIVERLAPARPPPTPRLGAARAVAPAKTPGPRPKNTPPASQASASSDARVTDSSEDELGDLLLPRRRVSVEPDDRELNGLFSQPRAAPGGKRPGAAGDALAGTNQSPILD